MPDPVATTVRSLADEGKRFYIMTTPPTNPASPTVAEFAAAIDASFKVSREGFSWTPTDSDTVEDPELGSTSKAVAPSYDNADLGFTVYRYWLDSGGVDSSADDLFTAVKGKGTVLHGYYFHNDTAVGVDPVANEEFILGAEFWVDHAQDPGASGWLKFKVPCHANQLYPWGKVAAAVGP